MGVDGPPVFLRIPPGLNAYDGFTRPRIGPSLSYPSTGVRFARQTTRDLYTVLAGRFYRDTLKKNAGEYQLNKKLMAECRQQRLTLTELINRRVTLQKTTKEEGGLNSTRDETVEVPGSCFQSDHIG